MSAAPIAKNPPVEDKFRLAALAAVMAVKTAAPATDINTAVANSGISQTLSPMATASIAMSIADLVRKGAINDLTSELVINTIATAAAQSETPSDPSANVSAATSSLPAGTPGQSAPVPDNAAVASTPFDTARLYEVLSQSTTWEPVAAIFERAGNGDRTGFDAALHQLQGDGFIALQEDHAYVTESGRRFLEYAKYSLK